MDSKTILENNIFMETKGFSMYPFIRDKDKVIVKKLNARDLKIGDVVLYKDNINNMTVCHRFIKKVESQNGLILFTRGDSVGILCEPVSEDDFIGQVVGVVRNGRILNLRTKRQVIFNWFNAKFYGFLSSIFNFLKRILIILLQNFSLRRKLY